MRITKFRIRNYKSIIDSGDCYLEDDMTIFAGKNESGKTSILEALKDFSITQTMEESVLPIRDKDKVPEIQVNLMLNQEELNKFYEINAIDKTATKDLNITIVKTYPDEYSITSETKAILGLDDKSLNQEFQKIKEKLKSKYAELQMLHDKYFKSNSWKFFNLDLESVDTTETQFNSYKTNCTNSWLGTIPDGTIRSKHQVNLDDFTTLLQEMKTFETDDDKSASIDDLIPNFILFRSFEDILPNEVKFEELENNDFIDDLSIVSELDVALITSDDERSKGKHKKELNVALNSEYSQFWIQDLTKINIDWNSDTIYLWIEEDGELYKPSERSKGKQWHMSFYIKVTARTLEKKTNVILIDEPGLFLHAAAQNDVYKKLLDRSASSQIIFTTHSPYLLNREELNRIRLVLKKDTHKNGTVIENKIHAKADKETLTPILTAIGLGLSDGIQNINQEKNVIVEGPSDYFYLQSFKILLNNDSLSFIFGGGVGNMGKIGAILTGWGCKVLYLFDNDQGKKYGAKNLTKVWLTDDTLIYTIKDETGTVEDLFSKNDFKKYILQDTSIKIDKTNSEYVKNQKIDKVLVAKQFNSKCQNQNVTPTVETSKAFTNLFGKLEQAFEIYEIET